MDDPRSASDEALFAAYVGGDAAAFRELFRRYAPMLRRILGSGLPAGEDADDLVQQAFLQLHRARRDFRADAKLRPWLVTIALNTKRQRMRRTKLERATMTPSETGTADRSTGPYDIVGAEDARRLHAALATLPENQSRAIRLHWVEGLSFPEVARAVGASVSAVKVRAHRGYAALRERLGTNDRNQSERPGIRPEE